MSEIEPLIYSRSDVRPSVMADDPLDAFFNHRTIGHDNGRWYWRGPGYDEGWADTTDDDLRELHRLLTVHRDD